MQQQALQVGDPEDQASSGNQFLPPGVTVGCFMNVSRTTAYVGQTLTFVVQSVPFGPSYTACLSGTLNGDGDWDCNAPGPTGPTRYEFRQTLTDADVGLHRRHASIRDSAGVEICKSSEWTINVLPGGT